MVQGSGQSPPVVARLRAATGDRPYAAEWNNLLWTELVPISRVPRSGTVHLLALPKADFIRVYGIEPRHWMPAGACSRGSGGGHDTTRGHSRASGNPGAVHTCANRSKDVWAIGDQQIDR